MAGLTESLLYMLLPQDGGSAGVDICQYIADNSYLIQELPIDEHYKITDNYYVINYTPDIQWISGDDYKFLGFRPAKSSIGWNLDPTLYNNIAYYNLANNIGIASAQVLLGCTIMYENNVPFSLSYLSETLSYGFSTFTRDNKKQVTYSHVTVAEDIEHYTPNFGTLTLYNPNLSLWDGRIYSSNNYNQTRHIIEFDGKMISYRFDTDAQGEYPVYDYERQLYPDVQIPDSIFAFDVISDFPISVLNEKRLNLISAVNKRFYNIDNTEMMSFYIPPAPT